MNGPIARRAIPGALLLVFVAVVLCTAWLCDDAYITLRTVDNFANGYGLRWNVAERVQSFTHPLWLFLLSAAHRYTGEVYYSTVIASVLVSAAAFGVLLLGVARSPASALVAGSILLLSKSFVDFSTSGLENPLTHLLLAAFVWVAARAEPRTPPLGPLALIAGLAAVNRMDTLLLYLPLLALVWWRGPRLRGLGVLVLGFLPFVAWELFALLYYGFPFPNTAYAKLDTGIGHGELARQGLYYLLQSLRVDPMTLLTVLLGSWVALSRRRGETKALVAGLLSYLVYVVAVGGDFMSGRFLSPVVFGAALLIARLDLAELPRRAIAVGLAVLLVGGVAGLVLRATNRTVTDDAGIADERRVYQQHLGLRETLGRDGPPTHPWVQAGLELRQRNEPMLQIAGGVGMLGYYAGPRVHVLDVHGLTDPFLSRLPAEPDSRIGHFVREPRADYVESLRSGTNRIVEPDVARYCEKLFLITRGELLDPDRLRAIAAFNLGAYDHLLDAYLARRASARGVAARNPVDSPAADASDPP